uniref:Uncharacterized protein n=1 Tax=Rhizophagus irregularis (strain DAOM 181602 / DAOM 197198 / MUCL 43194) TaxID=747089 RepID=U9U9B9_RHIID
MKSVRVSILLTVQADMTKIFEFETIEKLHYLHVYASYLTPSKKESYRTQFKRHNNVLQCTEFPSRTKKKQSDQG